MKVITKDMYRDAEGKVIESALPLTVIDEEGKEVINMICDKISWDTAGAIIPDILYLNVVCADGSNLRAKYYLNGIE